jgi:hypothetical protein
MNDYQKQSFIRIAKTWNIIKTVGLKNGLTDEQANLFATDEIDKLFNAPEILQKLN